uniref:hypothetical protein n=1 Tax=Helicobacter pylori TaxID=210 RepID=UPI0036F19E1B
MACDFRKPVKTNRSGNKPKPSLIHISEPTRLLSNSYAVFCLKKKKKKNKTPQKNKKHTPQQKP